MTSPTTDLEGPGAIPGPSSDPAGRTDPTEGGPHPIPSTDYAVFWLDLGGKVTRWSLQAEALLGYSAEAAMGIRLADLLAAEAAVLDAERAVAEARDRGSWDEVGWVVTEGGARFRAAASVRLVRTPNGVAIGLMVVVRALEADLPMMWGDEDVCRLLSLGRVATEVSHDVRNILSAIRGFATVLERKLPAEIGMHQVWHELVKACDRGAQLTQRVLGVARAEPATGDGTRVRESLESLEPMLRQILPPSIELTFDVAERLPPVAVAAHDLELAVLNLVVNARDATPGAGTITVRARLEEVGATSPHGSVLLSVRDRGSGIPEHLRDRVFDRHFTTKPPSEGTGLGLALVRDTVRAVGGTIQIDSREGWGTEVHLRLPASRGVAGHRTSASPPKGGGGEGRFAPLPQGSGIVGQGSDASWPPPSTGERAGDVAPRILICTASPSLRDLSSDLLTRSGFRVWVVEHEMEVGPSGAATAEPFDAAVVDLTLADSSAHLRDALLGVPTVYVGRPAADPESRLDDGDRIVSPPVDPAEVLEAVRAATSRSCASTARRWVH